LSVLEIGNAILGGMHRARSRRRTGRGRLRV